MANYHPDTSGLVNFKTGYDSRREGNGRKPRASLDQALIKVLEKKPKDLFKLVGHECPPQYQDCDSVLEAMLAYAATMSLGATKGTRNAIPASHFLLDRLYGRPRQTIEVYQPEYTREEIEAMSDAELDRLENN